MTTQAELGVLIAKTVRVLLDVVRIVAGVAGHDLPFHQRQGAGALQLLDTEGVPHERNVVALGAEGDGVEAEGLLPRHVTPLAEGSAPVVMRIRDAGCLRLRHGRELHLLSRGDRWAPVSTGHAEQSDRDD
jgi:hypothetical protein